MRVTHLINSYLPRVGGAERMLASIAPLLRARGLDVQILARRYPRMAAHEVIGGVPVHRLSAPGLKVAASLSYTTAGLRRLYRTRPDLIHAHELFSTATTALAARRLLGVPVVVTPHRSGPLGDVQRLQGKLLGAQRLARLVEDVDAWVTISSEIERELLASGVPAERMVRVPNGVDTSRFAPVSPREKQALRSALALPPGAPVALFAGRLAREKRVSHLVDIWHMVRALHPSALLVILGAGPLEGALRQAAGAGVRFEGQVEDVAPYLQAADLFVLPSAAEGLSVALLEAMAAGLAVIATEVGGAPDVITHRVNGWLAPPDDVAALQEAVLALLARPETRRELGERACQRVRAEFSLPVIAERLCGLYSEVHARAGVRSA